MGNSYLSNVMIPLMMTLVLGYYAARLLIFHDTESITGKDNGKKLKDKEKYVAESGKLILFLAAGSFVRAILMYFSVHAAVVEIAVWFVVFGILWKRMNDKYGTPNSHKKK